MAITLTDVAGTGERPHQPIFVHRMTVLFDTSYPTGGEVLGLSAELDGATILSVCAEAQAGYDFLYDYANDKLKVLDMSTDAEVTNGTDLHTVTAVVTVVAY